MAIKAETIYIEVDARIAKALKGLKDTDKQSNKLFKSFKSLAGPLAIGAVIATTIKLGKEFSKAASNAEEIGSKYATIFRDMTGEAEGMADGFAESFGLAGSTARELLGDTADLLTGFGLTQDAAADVSLATNELAADLASFSNAQGGAAAVSRALTAAYSGERESLKTYGIVINDAMIKTQLLKQETEGLTFASDQQAKIAATLTLATQQSGNAIGDVARTFNSHANVTRRLEQSTLSLKEALGKSVNKGMTPMLIVTENIVSGITDWINKNEELKSSQKAVEDGSATTLQNILVLEKKVADERAKIELAKRDAYAERNTLEMESLALVKESGTIGIGLLVDEAGLLDGVSEKKELNIRQLERQLAYQMQLLSNEKDAQAVINATTKEEELAAKLKIEANEKLAQLKRNNLTDSEKEIAAIQQQINYWSQYRDTVVGAEEIFQELALQKIELQNEELISIQELFDGKTVIADEWRAAELARIFEIEEARIVAADKEISLARKVSDAKMALMGTAFNTAGTLLENDTKRNKEHAKRNWVLGKALAISEAVINTKIAFTKALTIDPFGILAAITAVSGGLQIAAIASEPMPAFATGGSFVTDGQQNITVGDNAGGQEKVTVEPLGGNNSNQTMILNIDGTQFTAWLQNKLDNGGLRVPRRVIV